MTSATCLQPSGYRRPLPQPVYSHRAADDLYYNLSTAIELQTTSATYLQPSSCRQPPPQPIYSHRAADDLYRNLSTAIRLQTTSTITRLQLSSYRRPLPQPQPLPPLPLQYTIQHRTIGVPQIRR